ncbi:MAG: DUF6055 domain-containing protein [Planctomycetota bacterium]
MSRSAVCYRAAAGLWLSLCLFPVLSGETPQTWLDNERKFKSDDSSYNFRRSEHFRIIWGKGAAKNKNENADFSRVTEELVQGNLQMLEQVWHKYHDPAPKGMGFHVPDGSCNPKFRDGKLYRANLMMNNTGIWAGGAWGSCDEWGFQLFALPPSYLRSDPPSGATPHEYGHTVLINAGGFNETPYDGMWHEATVNWLMLQFENSYPGPGGVGTQPYLSVPHGRNYYDCWQIWEYLKEDPKYGYAFFNKLWTEAHGNKAKGGEYLFDALVRLDTSGSPDSCNAIKDVIGRMAARSVTWDYERQPYFQKHTPRTPDPFSEFYRRPCTELVRRSADTTWFRVPFAHAPMQCGYNIVPIALEGKAGGNYPVSVNFKPLWDATRRSDWRATLVAVNDNGGSRYSTLWNSGINTITLSTDENRLFLTVAATPDFMPYEGGAHPLVSDLTLQPQAYEVSFVNTKATAYETRPAKPAGVAGKAHGNGGGFVADTAKVAPTAYVGPNAMVLDKAQVLENARVQDYAVVMNDAVVKEDAWLSGHALVKDRAQVFGNGKVRDWATVAGSWKVYENGRALERAWLVDRGELFGNATIKGNTQDFGNPKVRGYAIKDGDCSNGASIDHQVLTCWVWGTDQKYADSRPDSGGLYCCYQFSRQSPIYALDKNGVMHGYLMGAPKTVAIDDKGLGGALELNGKDQYVELKRDVSDFSDTTIAVWVNWAGGQAGQRILHFGDGGSKYAYLTPKDEAAGKLKFVISVSGKKGEQALAGPAELPVKTWTHVAVTLKGGAGTLYVDGKAVAANEKLPLAPEMVLGPNTLAGNDCMFLGRGDAGGYFAGLFTDFRVYVQPQEAAVIATLAEQLKNRNAAAVAGPKETAPPALANPAFLMKPTAAGDSAAMMSAVKDPDKTKSVEYLFECVAGGGHSSGWISANWWTDCGLKPGTTCAYRLKLRDGRGNETPASAPAEVAIPKNDAAPEADFEAVPRGVSTSAIRMTAKKAPGAAGLVEYKFVREDGNASEWQSSPTWTDAGLAAGSEHSYTVQARDAWGNAGKVSAAKSAVARDDTPPARYKVGEWQSLPYATLDNCMAMRAMSVTGEEGCPKIEPEPVEYFFHCVSGNAPDSGWIAKPFYKTAALPDGKYSLQFKIRDTSPQHNETPYSSVEEAVISPMTGYHEYALPKLADQPEGTLVSFKGKVTAVEPDSYTVSSGGATVKVQPQTVASATKVELKDRDVTVRGCVWICSGQKCVTWAEVK